MLNRTKIGTGILALALLVAAPLAAAETFEAEASYTAMTLEFAATVACSEAELTSLTGVLSCPEGVEGAAQEAAEAACAEHGMWVDEIEIDCWHLGGGWWHYSARFSCTREITVVV